METNQNIQDRIDELFKQNSKIPFMQSKDILLLGYQYGIEDKQLVTQQKSNKKKPIESEDEGFIGTTKDIINKTNKIVKDQKDKYKEFFTDEQRKQIEKDTRIKLLGEILMYMKDPNHDYIGLFDYLNNMVRKLQTNGTFNYMNT